jgi:LacI family sucrose operon transcriptional repressor
MAKLADVAALAGVSVTTVSRVINNYGSLSEKTKQKVFAAMRELNYAPNTSARSLQGKKTKLVGLIFPGVTNPFFGEIVQTLENMLFAKGYRVILCNSVNNADKEREYVRMLLANQVDGIITGTHNMTIEEYERIEAPIVSFDRHIAAGIPIVSSDNLMGGQIATRGLLRTGAQNVWMLTGANRPLSPTNQRLVGYQQVMAEGSLAQHVLELPFSMQTELKWAKIREVLQHEKPDGIFASDDLAAMMVLEVARQLGISVPTDMRVVGYDGSQLIRNYFPDLATVMQPISALCELMIDILLKQVEDADAKVEPQYELPVELKAGRTLLG